jgi:hypothetical protein
VVAEKGAYHEFVGLVVVAQDILKNNTILLQNLKSCKSMQMVADRLRIVVKKTRFQAIQ